MANKLSNPLYEDSFYTLLKKLAASKDGQLNSELIDEREIIKAGMLIEMNYLRKVETEKGFCYTWHSNIARTSFNLLTKNGKKVGSKTDV